MWKDDEKFEVTKERRIKVFLAQQVFISFTEKDEQEHIF